MDTNDSNIVTITSTESDMFAATSTTSASITINNGTTTSPVVVVVVDDISTSTESTILQILKDAPPFYKQLHKEYIQNLITKLESLTSYEGAVTEHLKVSGVYWSLTAYCLLEINNDIVNDVMKLKSSLIDWVFTCYDPSCGGFGGNTGQDGHILYTLSALQILAIGNYLQDERLLSKRDCIIQFISNLQQQSDGSFCGDQWGEIDTRFTYCALSSLSILNSLQSINIDLAAQYIIQCRNYDGGFGSCIGAESHAGQVFTCIGSLAIAQRLHWLVDVDTNCTTIGWWLCERQCDSGGLNGRPEKQADVCYSWWIVSALSILNKLSWINCTKLGQFILKCQDDIDGGIADRPDDMADVFHTFFGIAGLSLLGYLQQPNDSTATTFRTVDPIYALPTDVVQQLNLPGQVLLSKSNGTSLDPRLSMYTVLEID